MVSEEVRPSGETCARAECRKKAVRRGLCGEHHRLSLPRCQVNGCPRPAVSLKMCWPHRKLWGGPVQTRHKRSSTGETRVLAWGRLYLATDAIRRVEEEARRRGESPSGLLAEIVEHWARQITEEGPDLKPEEAAKLGARPAASAVSSASRP